jgi:hypothetical protein
MHNGNRKGGAVAVYNAIYSSPGLENLWQLHWSYTGGLEYNAPSTFIANIEDPAALGTALANPAPAPAPGGGRGGSGGGGRGGSGGRGGGGGGGGRGGGHVGAAFWIKVTARPDGSFTVLNSRNDFSKIYAARK